MHKRLEELHHEFASLSSPEEIYHKIMEWGKRLPSFNPAWKTDDNRVEGCQSLMHLHCEPRGVGLYFFADSDALISRGLAALLLFYYNGESAETILKTPPTFLTEWKIVESLTPGRANGVASLYHKMKQEAVKSLLTKITPTQACPTLRS